MAPLAGCVTRTPVVHFEDRETVLLQRSVADGSTLRYRLDHSEYLPTLQKVVERQVDATAVPSVEITPLAHVDPAPSPWPHAGVTLRGATPAIDREILGETGSVVWVADIEVGSPAWLAGVRRGDLIERVDGAAVPPVETLARRIAELGEAEGQMQWQVRRGRSAPFEATMQLADYRKDTELWVPLVVHVEGEVQRDRWSLGPLGLVMSNRNTYLYETRTREPETENVFSALLGLLRVETRPRETEVRLLWFICLET